MLLYTTISAMVVLAIAVSLFPSVVTPGLWRRAAHGLQQRFLALAVRFMMTAVGRLASRLDTFRQPVVVLILRASNAAIFEQMAMEGGKYKITLVDDESPKEWELN